MHGFTIRMLLGCTSCFIYFNGDILLSGGGIGYFSGLLNTNLNWRWTFRILGIAGLSIIPFSIIILYEPRRVRESRRQHRHGKPSYSVKVSLKILYYCKYVCIANFN